LANSRLSIAGLLRLPQEALHDPQDPSAPGEPFSGPEPAFTITGIRVHHGRNRRS
jgi:hypothetical protein